ncbi:toprim domain-containing protein [Bacillus sp. FSL K6-3431]|uniref:toprim domain-containing protein n=1 Tax=Bacillus sp. FSL K6-3431 TaxID=2921500 RepID=UPI0030F6F334
MKTAPNKVIIVEGLSDKKRVARIVKEPVDIICTNGTISFSKLDELVEVLDDKEVYILVDADKSGEKLRKVLKREFPMAHHLYIDRTYKEVATAPYQYLATMLLRANMDVDAKYL